MLALLPDPTPPHDLAIGEAPEPRPAAAQLVVEIRAISLNYGEVAYRTGAAARRGGSRRGQRAARRGVTALRAVRRLGSVLSRRVLVTGASGGVGRYAVQLLALSGADVVASVGSPGRGVGLTELGAREVVVEVFVVGDGFGADLTVLLDLAARGRLDLQVGRRGRWEEITEFIDGLLSRRIPGKAVLEVR